MYADAQGAVGARLQREGVVEVLGVVRVDGAGGHLAQVEAVLEIGGAHGVGQGRDLGLDGGRELRLQLVLMVDGGQLGARLEGAAEDLGDLALGIEVRIVPGEEADDDFVADLWSRHERRALRGVDIDVLRKTRVVGGDEVELAGALERAGEGLFRAQKDADDAAVALAGRGAALGPGGGLAAEGAAGGRGVVEAYDHAVAVHGGAGILGGDLDGFRLGRTFDGLDPQQAAAAGFDLEDAGDQIGVDRQAVPVGFYLHDGAAVEQAVELEVELAELRLLEPEFGPDFRAGEGDVVATPQQLEQTLLVFHHAEIGMETRAAQPQFPRR